MSNAEKFNSESNNTEADNNSEYDTLGKDVPFNPEEAKRLKEAFNNSSPEATTKSEHTFEVDGYSITKEQEFKRLTGEEWPGTTHYADRIVDASNDNGYDNPFETWVIKERPDETQPSDTSKKDHFTSNPKKSRRRLIPILPHFRKNKNNISGEKISGNSFEDETANTDEENNVSVSEPNIKRDNIETTGTKEPGQDEVIPKISTIGESTRESSDEKASVEEMDDGGLVEGNEDESNKGEDMDDGINEQSLKEALEKYLSSDDEKQPPVVAEVYSPSSSSLETAKLQEETIEKRLRKFKLVTLIVISMLASLLPGHDHSDDAANTPPKPTNKQEYIATSNERSLTDEEIDEGAVSQEEVNDIANKIIRESSAKDDEIGPQQEAQEEQEAQGEQEEQQSQQSTLEAQPEGSSIRRTEKTSSEIAQGETESARKEVESKIKGVNIGSIYTLPNGIYVHESEDYDYGGANAIGMTGSELLQDPNFTIQSFSILDPETHAVIAENVTWEEGTNLGQFLEHVSERTGKPVEELTQGTKIHIGYGDKFAGWADYQDIVNKEVERMNNGE